MRHALSLRALPVLLVAGLLLLPGLSQQAQAQRHGERDRDAPPQQREGERHQEQPRLSSREAAAQATARHGGKVLKVSRSGQGYLVKLLQDNGRVMTVRIGD